MLGRAHVKQPFSEANMNRQTFGRRRHVRLSRFAMRLLSLVSGEPVWERLVHLHQDKPHRSVKRRDPG